MNVLVLNCGSSTVKFQVIATDLVTMESDTDQCLAAGIVDRIGGKSQLTFKVDNQVALRESKPLRDHKAAIEEIISWVISEGSGINAIRSMADVHAVGHRVDPRHRQVGV